MNLKPDNFPYKKLGLIVTFFSLDQSIYIIYIYIKYERNISW
jgi:hypothetical protein